MRKTICYPVSSLDKKIAQREEFRALGYVPAMIANLRAVYDSRHAVPFAPDTMSDEDVILEKFDTLYEFQKSLRDKDRTTVSNTGAMFSDAFMSLVQSNISSVQRRVATDIIAQEFVRVAKHIAKNTGKSMLEVCKNEFDIFEKVYSILSRKVDPEYETTDSDVISLSEGFDEMDLSDDDLDFLETILDNFGALSVFSRVMLKSTDNIILGASSSYAAQATEENWEEIIYNDLYNVEEETKESWQEASNMRSAYSRVSSYVRHILSSVEIPGYSIAGYNVRYSGSEVHQHLAIILRGVLNSRRMMEVLAVASESGDSMSKAVLQKIANDPQAQRSLYATMKHGFTPYSEVKPKAIYSLNNIARSYYNRYIYSVTAGHADKNTIFYKGRNGNILVDATKLKQLIGDKDKFVYSKATQTVEKGIDNIFAKIGVTSSQARKAQLAELETLIVKHAQAWGLPMSATTISTLLSKAKTRKQLLNAFTSLYSKEGIPALLEEVELLQLPLDAASVITSAVKQTKGAEGVEMSTATQKALSQIIDMVEEVERDNKYPSTARAKSKKGKDTTIHSNTPPCFMTDFFDPIIEMAKEGDYEGIKQMLIDRYEDVSYFYDAETNTFRIKWLQDLVTATKGEYLFADNLEHTRTVQYTTDTGKVISMEDTTEKQKWTILATMYANTQGSNYDPMYAWYPVFVLGDSGSYRWIKAKKYSIDTIVDEMYNIFKHECLLKSQIDSINSTITEGSKIEFGNEDGSLALLPFLSYSDNDTLTEKDIKDKIREFYQNEVKRKLSQLETQGIIEQNEDGTYTDKAGIVPKGQKLENFIEGWVYNSEFATMQQFQLMTISPDFYKNVVDLQKRFKEIHASGTAMDIFGRYTTPDDSGQPSVVPIFSPAVTDKNGVYETAIYFKDIVINPQEVHDYFIEILGQKNKKSVSKYTKKGSTLTDGQGYRTLDSYRQIAMAQGRWDEKGAEEAAYQLIKKLRQPGLSAEERINIKRKIDALRVTFQAEKPFCFSHEKLKTSKGESVYIPVQHKCSEIVLIPELLPDGSNLQSLAYAMEDLGIDVAYSTTVVKVGMFGETDLTGVNGAANIKTALSKATKHSINLSNYYRQQNVPPHVNQARQLGTQLMKIPFVGLDLTGNTEYNYFDDARLEKSNGKIVLTKNKSIDNPKNGRGILRFYNMLICSGIMDDCTKFMQGIKNIPELSAKMQQTVLANSRNTLDSLLGYSLTENNQFLVPLFELGMGHDAISLLLSWFRKQVLHRTIAGGAAVQASAYGIAKIETDEKDTGKLGYTYAKDKDGNPTNIIHMEAELSWDLTYTDASGRTRELNYDTYCNEDGTLKTDSSGEILLDRDYPGIRNIVAYRIPTENDYSVMNLTVVRFARKINGGIIKVPLEGTTIAGFDFKQYWSH